MKKKTHQTNYIKSKRYKYNSTNVRVVTTCYERINIILPKIKQKLFHMYYYKKIISFILETEIIYSEILETTYQIPLTNKK